MMKGPIFFDMNVEFEDIRFLRATGINKGQTVEFHIMVHTGTGRFEISENATAVVTGCINEIEKMGPLTELQPLPKTDFPLLQERDFYKELRLRGYHYSGAFRSVIEARGDGLYGKVRWDLNWISFMDCLLQINILSKDTRSLLLPTRWAICFARNLQHFSTNLQQFRRIYRIFEKMYRIVEKMCRIGISSNLLEFLPNLLNFLTLPWKCLSNEPCPLCPTTRIQKMRINAKDHMQQTTQLDPENPYFEVQVCPKLQTLRCGGIEIFGMHTNPVARRKAPGYPVLETYKFLPYFAPTPLLKSDAVRCVTQLVLENTPMLKVKAIEVDASGTVKPLLPLFELAFGDLPLVTCDLMFLTPQDLQLGKIHVEDGKLSTQSNCLLVITERCFDRHTFVDGATKSLLERGYLVSRESRDLTAAEAAQKLPAGYAIITMIPTDDQEQLVLLQRMPKRSFVQAQQLVVDISNTSNTTTADSYEWLQQLQTMTKTGKNVIVVAQNNSRSGIVGLINCLRKEPDGMKTVCVFIDDKLAPPFRVDSPFYQEQLKLGLAVNILRNVSRFDHDEPNSSKS